MPPRAASVASPRAACSSAAPTVSREAPCALPAVLSAYVQTWRWFIAHWTHDWPASKQAAEEMRGLFRPVPVAANLQLNAVSHGAMFLVLLAVCGFSAEFQRFAATCIVAPSVACSALYYHYKYGAAAWAIGPGALYSFVHNWVAMQGVALVSWTQGAVTYGAVLLVEPLFPESMRGAITFPLPVVEEYFTRLVYFFWVLGAGLLLTLPVWRRGYRISMDLVGRQAEVSGAEHAIEILYQTAQGTAVFQTNIPVAILHAQLGFPFHIVHFMAAVVEIIFINFFVQMKFCNMHQLAHQVQPLYQLTHYEHHVCKGIHPSTSAAGLWEFWMYAGTVSPTCFGLALHTLPYVQWVMIYCGANVVVHTMWPSERWAQWHTLHHVVLADVYAVNVPSAYDEAHSVDFKKHNKKMSEVSPFASTKWVSDAVAFVFMIIGSIFFHYVFGWSVFAVWHEAQWT